MTFDGIYIHVFNEPMDDLRAVNPLHAQRLWRCDVHLIGNKIPCAKRCSKKKNFSAPVGGQRVAKHLQAQ